MVSNQLQSRPEFKGYDGRDRPDHRAGAGERLSALAVPGSRMIVVRKGASPSQHGVSEGLDIVPGASPQADVVKGVRDATSA
jgi:hypothetical protein